MRAAAEAGDNTGVALISSRLLESLRGLANLSGGLRQVSGISVAQNTLDVFASPEFTALAQGLLGIARAHPTARADILTLLRRLEAQPPEPNGTQIEMGRPESTSRPLIESEAVHID